MITLATPVSSSIIAVTVYRQGATVTREVAPSALSMALTPANPPSTSATGRASVVLTGLPLGIDERSVRVTVSAADSVSAESQEPPFQEASFSACDVHVRMDSVTPDPTLRPAKNDALENARLEVELLETRSQGLQQRWSRLEEAQIETRPSGPNDSQPVASPVTARLGFVTWVAQEHAAIDSELADVRQALEAAKVQWRSLAQQDAERTTAKQGLTDALSTAIVVTLTGLDDGPVRGILRVSYGVTSARWAPAYAVRVSAEVATDVDLDAALRADIAMRAHVAQHTGEDWSDVALRLSTATPERWCERPELTSIRIGRAQPAARSGWRPAPTDTDRLFADLDRFNRTSALEQHLAPAPVPRSYGGGGGQEISKVYAPETERYEEEGFLGDEGEPSPMVGGSADDEFSGEFMEMAQTLHDDLGAPQSRSSGGFSLPSLPSFGGAGPPAASAPARPKSVSLKRSRSAPARPRKQVLEAANPSPGDDLLNYSALRLGGPSGVGGGQASSNSQRGRIAPVPKSRHASMELASSPPSGTQATHDYDYDYAFDGQVPISVPSDGQYHAVPVTTHEAPANMHHIVVPRVTTDVFRVAQIANPLAGPLLPGPADIYVDRDFLLTTPMLFTPPGGEVSLGLGVEQAIKVARNTTFKEANAGLLGTSTLLDHSITIEVQNHLPRVATLEVRERLPWTPEEQDEPEVRLSRVSPAWESWPPPPNTQTASGASGPTHQESGLEGGYRWVTEVPSGGEQRYEVEYSIKMSAKHELVGGNRREQ